MAKAKKKFDAGKLAALFKEEGGPPVQKVEVKKNDPTVTGKGVSKAVKAHVTNKQLEEDLGPTQADKDRQFKAAKQRALTKVLQLPPTDEDKKVVASTGLAPDVKVMRFHGKGGWAVCLMWLEQRIDEKEGPVLAKVHAIVQDDNASLIYEKMRPEALRWFAEIVGGYPIGPGIEAFRKHADTYGSTREVRDLLGLKGPAPAKMITVQVRDDDGRLLGEKKMPKPNKNKEAGAEVSADTDELYKRAAKLLDIKEEDLRQKYHHLNPGLQAMNLRNRLRAKGFTV